MSKKIIFIGPPGAGKTTLKKVFFEGESPTKLIEYALKPTHGYESSILKLSKNVGVFDLAGQENKLWLETEKKSIFYDTKVILIVFDIMTSIDNILDFIRKIIKIRDNLTPSSIIYIFLHKIDLVSKKKIRELNSKIKFALIKETQINVVFTSIKKEYFTQTYSFFIDILKSCLLDEYYREKIDFNFIKEAIRLLYPLDQEQVISKKDLQVKLNRSEEFVNDLIEHLVRNDHIYEKDKKEISLTEKGKKHFNEILKNFSLEEIVKFEENFQLTEIPSKEKSPSFIGYFISDKYGINFVIVELYDGIIDFYIKKDIEAENEKVPFDLDLVSCFVSALDTFSMEINIQDLSGVVFKGANLKLQIFSFDKYNVTFFTNPYVNIDSIENKIRDYFNSLFIKYNKEFNMVSQTGDTNILFHLSKTERQWLVELNKSYDLLLKNLEFYDLANIKTLNNQLEELYVQVSENLEKIRQLKMNLMKAVLEDNFEEITLIDNEVQNMQLDFKS